MKDRKKTSVKKAIKKAIWPAWFDEKSTYPFMLFGAAGSWEEYNVWGNTKEELMMDAIKHLKYGHDAHILEVATGKIWNLSLKDKSK